MGRGGGGGVMGDGTETARERGKICECVWPSARVLMIMLTTATVTISLSVMATLTTRRTLKWATTAATKTATRHVFSAQITLCNDAAAAASDMVMTPTIMMTITIIVII